MLQSHARKNLDTPLLLLTYGIAVFGMLILYSATHSDPGAAYKKQAIWMVLGSLALAGAASINYNALARFARTLYAFNLILLLAVLKVAHTTNGAARWIRLGGFEFQPSEFAKLFVIITLAAFLTDRVKEIKRPATLVLSFFYVLAPALLIFKQPDLGTALVVLNIWFCMAFIAGARVQHLLLFLLIGGLLFAGAWRSGKFIKGYQKERLTAFMDPQANARGAGYHEAEARMAIGSGEVWGKGLMHSTQVRGGYIPEKQTDFIFTDVGEETGFVGSLALTFLYALLLIRCYVVIADVDDQPFGKLVATGITSMIATHVIVNMGMNVGLLPVAGVPLPLVSAGGSNVLVTLFSIGLLESIAIRKRQLLF